MIPTQVDCPLCDDGIAERWALRLGDGYQYRCGACGGPFEFGPSAKRQSDHGQLPAAIKDAARQSH